MPRWHTVRQRGSNQGASQQARLPHAEDVADTDDQVVRQMNALRSDQRSNPTRCRDVDRARANRAGGVIVCEDQSASVQLGRPSKKRLQAGYNVARVADGDTFIPDVAMPSVQKYRAQLLTDRPPNQVTEISLQAGIGRLEDQGASVELACPCAIPLFNPGVVDVGTAVAPPALGVDRQIKELRETQARRGLTG